MIDHFNLPVADPDRSAEFYRRVLAPLGFSVLMRDGDAIGFGVDTWGFGVVATDAPIPSLHVAFVAKNRWQVDAFFTAAIAAGARPRDPPAIVAEYDPDYYAAYVTDPDGHNVEAVCRVREY
jgi:catechol 2,3-dioxygenase-like lactoylglutathione lyase family enzyme